MLTQKLQAAGAVINQKRESLWSTFNHLAVAGDEAFGLVVGKTYTIWVAQKNGTTKSGSAVTKGDWFPVEVK